MALITEEGTARSDAESFATVAFADTYHSNRANTAWAALTTALKEAALRKATDHMGQEYARRWLGHRTTSTQALEWPRQWVPLPSDPFGNYYASTVIPVPVQSACAELALRASAGELTEDTGQEIKREKIGQIETEYQDHSRAGTRYPAVDRLLAPLMGGSFGVPLAKA